MGSRLVGDPVPKNGSMSSKQKLYQAFKSWLPKEGFFNAKNMGHSQKMSSIDLTKTFVHLFTNLHVPVQLLRHLLRCSWTAKRPLKMLKLDRFQINPLNH